MMLLLMSNNLIDSFRFFLIIEQPFGISLPSLISGCIKGNPLVDSVKWRGDQYTTLFHLIDRSAAH